MFNLANQYQVHLLTNYETSWYPSIREAYRLIHQENLIGEIRRIVINVGNRGPIEVGCKAEFIEWLIDPKFNGAGALADFGCYGTNLATWFMKGAPPTRVNCLTQQFKPELYPKVDDDATLILTYPKAQVIIQASWHWSLNRKDIEIYGSKGHIICTNSEDMIIMKYGQGDARSAGLWFGDRYPVARCTGCANRGTRVRDTRIHDSNRARNRLFATGFL